jgi:hypothetical protein
MKKGEVNTSLLIINVSGLNSLIRGLAECIKKQDPTVHCLQKTHLIGKDTIN